MTWNHRVVKRTFPKKTLGKGKKKIVVDAYTQYGIHEAFYDEKGMVEMVTQEPVRLVADNPKDLKEIYDWMGLALKAPVLIYESVGKKKKPSR